MRFSSSLFADMRVIYRADVLVIYFEEIPVADHLDIIVVIGVAVRVCFVNPENVDVVVSQ